MSVAFPTIPEDVFTAAVSSGNATVSALAPVIKLHLDHASELAGQLQEVSRAAESAEADLDTSDVEEAVTYRNAASSVTEQEEKYAAAKAKAKADYEAQLAKVDNHFSALKENRKAINEAKVAAIRAIASKKSSQVDVSGAIEEYKEVTKLIKTIGDTVSLSLASDNKLTAEAKATIAKLVPNLPTSTALSSTRKSLASAIKGDGGWRPRFDGITVNGQEVERRTNKDGSVGRPSLQAAAKLAGVTRDAILGRLENVLGGHVFTDASLDDNGSLTFDLTHNDKKVVFVVTPSVKNEEDATTIDEENTENAAA